MTTNRIAWDELTPAEQSLSGPLLAVFMAFARKKNGSLVALLEGRASASMTIDYWDMDIAELVAPILRKAYAARIEALTAERDAAMKCVEAADKIVLAFEPAIADATAAGERCATAAIVADLRDVCGDWPRGTSHASILADRYERGDHLKPAP